eukprot:26388-Eustigmatos_ZCMA.PRE.1
MLDVRVTPPTVQLDPMVAWPVTTRLPPTDVVPDEARLAPAIAPDAVRLVAVIDDALIALVETFPKD